jgi:hypothetical protein
MKGQARNRLTGIHTRGSPGPDEVAPIIWGIDVLVSRRPALRLVKARGVAADSLTVPRTAKNKILGQNGQYKRHICLMPGKNCYEELL